MKDNKKFIFILLLALLMGVEGVVANKLYFPDLDIMSAGFFILIFGMCFWGILFFLPRILVWLALAFQIVLTSGLLLYHNYFVPPLSLSIIWFQYREGAEFLSKVPGAVLNYKSLIVLLVGLGNFWLYNRCYPILREYRRFFWIFLIPLALLIYASFASVSILFFSQSFFNDACLNFGYRSCWLYETVISKRSGEILDEIIELSESEPQIKYSFPGSRHIYVIQTESLTYNVINKKVDGRELTPFLNGLAAEGTLAEVNQKVHGASANTDFFVNSGGFTEKEFTIIYHMFLPKEVWPRLESLSQKAKANGYHTGFYHNFKSDFFNRGPHVRAQQYEDIYFYEDMKDRYPDDFWGISDRDLFDFVLKQNRKHSDDKLFNFIITLSSHSEYKVKNNPRPLFAKTPERKYDYYNAVNFVDQSLRCLVENSPDDSLFVIYGDHGVEEFGYRNIPLLVYSKSQKVNPLPQKIEMADMVKIIHSLF